MIWSRESTRPGLRVRLVGEGTRRPVLEARNAELGSPAEILGPVHGAAVAEQYAWADTLVVALRPDWPSFRHTVPSKTYEVLAVGRHITAVVRGEAAHVLTDAGEGDIVASDPEQIAALWRALEADRSRLVPSGSGREWVRHNADYADLSVQYDQHLRATVREYSRVCGQGVLPRLGRVLRAVTRGVEGGSLGGVDRMAS